MKDAVATMGDILPDDAGGRDAVHVAVFSAVSDERLKPGQHIGVTYQEGIDTIVSAVGTGDHVAIVDPFLKKTVMPGQRFWAYLLPRTITALSHRWSHPSFEDAGTVYVTPATRLESENWLQEFCRTHDAPDYDDLIKAVTGMADGKTRDRLGDIEEHADFYGWWSDGEFLGFVGQDAHCAIPLELWDHVENVIGRQIKGSKPSYFLCSC